MTATFSIQGRSWGGESEPVKRPKEFACFSYDADHKFHIGASSLKWYYPPRLGADLSEGYESFVKHDDSVDEHLDSLLKTVMHHEQQTGKEVDAHIMTWRGIMTKIMSAPFDDRDGGASSSKRTTSSRWHHDGSKIHSHGEALSHRKSCNFGATNSRHSRRCLGLGARPRATTSKIAAGPWSATRSSIVRSFARASARRTCASAAKSTQSGTASRPRPARPSAGSSSRRRPRSARTGTWTPSSASCSSSGSSRSCWACRASSSASARARACCATWRRLTRPASPPPPRVAAAPAGTGMRASTLPARSWRGFGRRSMTRAFGASGERPSRP